jgi:uncharacterized protein YeaO (DUF488 family)
MSMKTYNPLILADTISVIARHLPLEALDRLCWINRTWYKEVARELRIRWRHQALKWHKCALKMEEELAQQLELIRASLASGEASELVPQDTDDDADAVKLVALSNAVLRIGMICDQEKETAMNNIWELATYGRLCTWTNWGKYWLPKRPKGKNAKRRKRTILLRKKLITGRL